MAQRAEKADGPVPMMPANARAVRQALEAAGVRFTEEGGVLPPRPGDTGGEDFLAG